MSKGPQFLGKEAEAASPTPDWGKGQGGLGVFVEIREKEPFT